jgi:hypothetical protein
MCGIASSSVAIQHTGAWCVRARARAKARVRVRVRVRVRPRLRVAVRYSTLAPGAYPPR